MRAVLYQQEGGGGQEQPPRLLMRRLAGLILSGWRVSERRREEQEQQSPQPYAQHDRASPAADRGSCYRPRRTTARKGDKRFPDGADSWFDTAVGFACCHRTLSKPPVTLSRFFPIRRHQDGLVQAFLMSRQLK